MQKNSLFPFVAIVGQERLKKGVLIAILNPKVGGLLIGGATGTCKTVAVRSVRDFCLDKKIVEVPLNVTEDVLFGSIDIKKAVLTSEKKFAPGILARADGNIIYIDDANLLREELVKAILDINMAGENIVEIDGVSYAHFTHYSVLATMNSQEAELDKNIFKRFGMYVESVDIKEVSERVEIMKRLLEYNDDMISFRKKYEVETEKIRKQLERAKKILPRVEVSNAMIELATTICIKANCEGHRTELYLLEVARTIAALDGRSFILPKDLDEASEYVLIHKMRKKLEQNQEDDINQEEDQEEDQEEAAAQGDTPDGKGESSEADSENQDLEENFSNNEENDDNDFPDGKNEGKDSNALAPEEQVSGIDEGFKMPAIILDLAKNRKIKQGVGKRNLTKTNLKLGRYFKAVLPKGKVKDLAFDATIRAAAPYQMSRERNGQSLNIKAEDIRQKVREKRVGSTFLFIVDASGSMGARERMRAVKGALFNLLQEAYQKRDRVGLIVFRRNKAEVILPITRSVTLAKKHLEEMATGGKTPLPDALELGLATIQAEKKKQTDIDPVVFILTDGRANSSSNKNSDKKPLDEALDLAEKYAENEINTVLIDTESGFIKLGYAKKIAKKMNASYFTIEKITEESILKIIKNTIK